MTKQSTGRRWLPIWWVAGFVLASSLTGRPAHSEVLTIGAAHSLKPVLKEIVPLFESRYPSTNIHLVYGPSVTQREQIEQGAPLHIFLPASFDQIKHLHARGLVIDGPPRVFGRTTIVLITSAETPDSGISFHSLGSDVSGGRIAVADPGTSALGVLTMKLLATLGLFKHVAVRTIYGEHGSLIELVSSGEADLGIVYRVDAVHGRHVRIIDEGPGGSYVPVEFGAAVVWTCPPSSLPVARKFLDFMVSHQVQHIL